VGIDDVTVLVPALIADDGGSEVEAIVVRTVSSYLALLAMVFFLPDTFLFFDETSGLVGICFSLDSGV